MNEQEATTKAEEILKVAEVAAADILRKAKYAAEGVVEKSTQQGIHVASEALRKVFGENEDSKRFVDVTKIPLICKSIVQLNEGMKDLKEDVSGIIKTMQAKTIEDVDRHAKQDLIFKIIAWGAGIIAVSLISTIVPNVIEAILHLLKK